jgi:hypothetical protein
MEAGARMQETASAAVPMRIAVQYSQKVFSMATSCSKYTGTLTFENFCTATVPRKHCGRADTVANGWVVGGGGDEWDDAVDLKYLSSSLLAKIQAGDDVVINGRRLS